MANNNADLGNLKSRDLGNLISKQLVEMGKNEIQHDSPNSNVDYGNLPSRTLAETGKKVITNQMLQDKTTLS